jgi:hypothetical protein
MLYMPCLNSFISSRQIRVSHLKQSRLIRELKEAKIQTSLARRESLSPWRKSINGNSGKV